MSNNKIEVYFTSKFEVDREECLEDLRELYCDEEITDEMVIDKAKNIANRDFYENIKNYNIKDIEKYFDRTIVYTLKKTILKLEEQIEKLNNTII